MSKPAEVKVVGWKSQKAGSSAILPCTCANDFQDKEYGKGLRVFNIGGKTNSRSAACTSCGTKRS